MTKVKSILAWLKEEFSKKSIFTWILVASFVLGWIALIIYCVNATTGYLEGRSVSAGVVLLTLLALICEGVLVFIGDRYKPYRDLLFIAAAVCFIVSICIYVMERVEMAADVWFIPVNYPESEEATLMTGIVGVVFYVLTFLTLIAASVGKNLTKVDDTAKVETETKEATEA